MIFYRGVTVTTTLKKIVANDNKNIMGIKIKRRNSKLYILGGTTDITFSLFCFCSQLTDTKCFSIMRKNMYVCEMQFLSLMIGGEGAFHVMKVYLRLKRDESPLV